MCQKNCRSRSGVGLGFDKPVRGPTTSGRVCAISSIVSYLLVFKTKRSAWSYQIVASRIKMGFWETGELQAASSGIKRRSSPLGSYSSWWSCFHAHKSQSASSLSKQVQAKRTIQPSSTAHLIYSTLNTNHWDIYYTANIRQWQVEAFQWKCTILQAVSIADTLRWAFVTTT